MVVRGIYLLLFLLSLNGCAGLDSLDKAINNPQKLFERANTDFMQRLRWSDINGAAAHVSAPNRQKFKDIFRDEDDLKITDVRLDSAEFSADGEEVESWVEIEYYRLPSMTVKTFGYSQRWTFYGSDEVTPVGWKITTVAPPLP